MRKPKKSTGSRPAPTKREYVEQLRVLGVRNVPSRLTKAELKQKLATARAAATRERKRAAHEKRSIASRKGWATRMQKPKDLRAWETARKKVQQKEIEIVAKEHARAPKYPAAFRWYDGIYFDVSEMSLEQLYEFLRQLKKRGVRMTRFEREVMVGEYSRETMGRNPSGYVSSKTHFLGRLNDMELLVGNARYRYPSLKSMRVPGIDFIRFLVLPTSELQYLPRTTNMKLRELKRETRETIKDVKQQAFYLSKGRKPTNRRELQTELRKIEKRIAGIDEAEEGEEE